ncbi:MAG: L-threonylcarbamoyladenylate synthase [Cyanobium sp.]
MNAPARPWILEAEALAAHLLDGGAALFPTDTLPALAALPEAAAALWALKARPAHKPLILMGADLPQLRAALGQPWCADWLEMASAVWPGAVTLVLPLSGAIADCLHPGGGTLGMRVPACECARSLLRCTGPLATTSANRSGDEPIRDPDGAARVFPELPCLGPLPWPTGSGQASTVLAWGAEQEAGGNTAGNAASRQPWRVLRAGATIPSAGGAPA